LNRESGEHEVFPNEGENSLLRKFARVFGHNTDIGFFDALVGYFRASGYFSVRPFLGNVRMRLFDHPIDNGYAG